MERDVLINLSDNYRAHQLGAGFTSQAFGVPFSGELFLVLSSDSVPYRVTEGSLWDERWWLRPIDLFILSFAAMDILCLPQTDCFILLSLKRANKESITRDNTQPEIGIYLCGISAEK